ncbi:MAG: methylated-DNA--[protein]-cysteine S-methyltransferase [Planctomycetes bacterium]|nr:methylated-DNA--[protein]-cysteine S-methyltransferase [Planctomycetota bacterium]
MTTAALPDEARLYRAVLERDPEFEGVFWFAVRTTGIFCRPTCPARDPRPENVRYFAAAGAALAAGFRPCKRCKPLEPAGAPPAWLAGLFAALEREPGRRWSDADLAALGLEPVAVRRWFQRAHGVTFHAWHRARRLGLAHRRLDAGGEVLDSGLAAGWDSASGFRDAFAKHFGTSPARARGARLSFVTRLATPLGAMLAAADDEGVALLEFTDRRALDAQLAALREHVGGAFAPGEHPLLAQLERELGEYFTGARRRFEVPLRLAGTPFQEAVWRALAAVPYGETRSYVDLARAVGKPGASRAVGRANGQNRLAILLPCHRVLRADGALSGYAGGVWRKRALLELERAALRA